MKTEEQRRADCERTKKWREQNREKARELSRIARKRKSEEVQNLKKTVEQMKSLLDRHGVSYGNIV